MSSSRRTGGPSPARTASSVPRPAPRLLRNLGWMQEGLARTGLRGRLGAHTGRVVSGDRDHCDPDRPAPARRSEGPRGRVPDEVLEQPQTVRARAPHVPRRERCKFPTRHGSSAATRQTSPPTAGRARSGPVPRTVRGQSGDVARDPPVPGAPAVAGQKSGRHDRGPHLLRRPRRELRLYAVATTTYTDTPTGRIGNTTFGTDTPGTIVAGLPSHAHPHLRAGWASQRVSVVGRRWRTSLTGPAAPLWWARGGRVRTSRTGCGSSLTGTRIARCTQPPATVLGTRPTPEATGTVCPAPAVFGPGTPNNYCSFNSVLEQCTRAALPNYLYADGHVAFLSHRVTAAAPRRFEVRSGSAWCRGNGQAEVVSRRTDRPCAGRRACAQQAFVQGEY